MRREGMTQGVSAEPGVLRDGLKHPAHDHLHGANGEPLPGTGEKHGLLVDFSLKCGRQLLTLSLVVAKSERRVIAYRNDPLLSPFPSNFHLLAHRVDVLPIESLQLRDPHSGGV